MPEPLVLVHPFFGMPLFTVDPLLLPECYEAFPYLAQLRATLPTYPGQLYILDGKNGAETEKCINDWGRVKGYTFVHTQETDPTPLRGWGTLYKMIQRRHTSKVVVGGGFYEGSTGEEGCVDRAIQMLRAEHVDVTVREDLTFSGNSLIEGYLALPEKILASRKRSISA